MWNRKGKWRPPRVRKSPVKHSDYRSNLERRYAEILEGRKIVGEIRMWLYEPASLQIGGGARYTPDFLVFNLDGSVEFHEVKGFWREAAKVRLRVAIEKFPMFGFFVVTNDRHRGFVIEKWSK